MVSTRPGVAELSLWLVSASLDLTGGKTSCCSVMVPVEELIVVGAEVSTAGVTELCGGLAASFLVILQLVWAAKVPDVSDL